MCTVYSSADHVVGAGRRCSAVRSYPASWAAKRSGPERMMASTSARSVASHAKPHSAQSAKQLGELGVLDAAEGAARTRTVEQCNFELVRVQRLVVGTEQ